MNEEGRALNAEAVNVGLVLKAAGSHLEQESELRKRMCFSQEGFSGCTYGLVGG